MNVRKVKITLNVKADSRRQFIQIINLITPLRPWNTKETTSTVWYDSLYDHNNVLHNECNCTTLYERRFLPRKYANNAEIVLSIIH